MKILLISPCAELKVRRPKGIMMPQLALHILYGLTPSEYSVKIIEEEVTDINFDEDCDLVGISCMTANAPRAYFIAEQFQQRGKKVILGGVHPSILPDEASKYADTVVVGEAEGVWEQILEDFKNGRLQKRYHVENPSLEKYICTSSKTNGKKRLFNVTPIMTTRGCPYNCEFCCVNDLFGKKLRHTPIKNIIRDIIESKEKVFMFLDDNIIGNPKYAKDLFVAIKPLKIRWVGQSTISLANNPELMKLARESGCTGLFFGVESVSPVQLGAMRKSLTYINKLGESIKKIRDSGIHFHASMIFGFDNETKDVFLETLQFLNKNKVSSSSFNVLTPYPGTELYKRLKKEKRLIIEDWKHYDHNTVVFRPKGMTALELHEGRIWVKKEFNKISSTLRRLPDNFSNPWLYLALNRGARKSIKKDIRNLSEDQKKLLQFEMV